MCNIYLTKVKLIHTRQTHPPIRIMTTRVQLKKHLVVSLRGSWRQDELICSKLPVVKYLLTLTLTGGIN
jgi:hypothetical protein